MKAIQGSIGDLEHGNAALKEQVTRLTAQLEAESAKRAYAEDLLSRVKG
ncbi:hypothetical protein [Ruegeria sediminis]|nr:hypothetical protein [Ruegeria sediminis]